MTQMSSRLVLIKVCWSLVEKAGMDRGLVVRLVPRAILPRAQQLQLGHMRKRCCGRACAHAGNAADPWTIRRHQSRKEDGTRPAGCKSRSAKFVRYITRRRLTQKTDTTPGRKHPNVSIDTGIGIERDGPRQRRDPCGGISI